MIYIFLLIYSFFFNNISSYNISYKNYAQKNNQETAVLIVAYNRPEYFIQCIQALEKNKEATEIPFIFALDGGSQSKQKENCALIKKAKLKHKIILLRDHNYGCPKNHIDAYRFVFDWCTFKKMIMIQEDIVVTPTYITFMLNFHTWAKENYNNSGVVHSFSYCFLSPEEKRAQSDIVVEDRISWLFRTFCISSSTWNIIKPLMYTYEHFIDQIPLSQHYNKIRSKPGLWQDSYKIQDWMHAGILQKKIKTKPAEYYLNSSYKLLFFDEFSSPRTYINEDNIMAYALFMHDLVKLHTLVNRAISIGEYGISEESSQEFSILEKKLMLDTFAQDASLTNFIFTKNRYHTYPNASPITAEFSNRLDTFIYDIYNKH